MSMLLTCMVISNDDGLLSTILGSVSPSSSLTTYFGASKFIVMPAIAKKPLQCLQILYHTQ